LLINCYYCNKLSINQEFVKLSAAMVRKNIIFLTIFLIFSLGSIYGQDVIVSMSVSNQIVAGTDVIVEVMITKSIDDGFARFQQELPMGVTAKAGQSSNADFSFEDQRVNLIWLKLPAGEHLKISFTIQAHETIKGVFALGGKFSYIEEEDRNEVTVPANEITITPSPNIDPGLVVDIADFKPPTVKPEVTTQAFDVACYREAPYVMETDNSWRVNVLLSRGEVSRLARIEEQIPEGFEAQSIDNKGSIFSFKAGIAKFLWMELPDDPLLVLSYKLVPQEGQSLSDGAIQGTFTYMEGDVSKSIPITEKGFKLADATPGELSEYMASMQQVEADPVEQTPVVQKPVEQVAKPVAQKPAAGVIYKVQIRAARKELNIDEFFRPYRIGQEINKEFHEGWYKYTVGSFTQYKDARVLANQLINSSGLKEAFICAYADGERVPVKTALKMTNQVWFR
jgi:hypothetical protein